MFGVSFTELLLIGAVTLMIVGPSRLPKLLGTLGRWSAKLRRITTEVRYQSGIDDILRKEGITGGLSELRNLRNAARGGLTGLASSAIARPAPRSAASVQPNQAPQPAAATSGAPQPPPPEDPYADVAMDPSREYPPEGCDAYGALPDDLWSPPGAAAAELSSAAASSAASSAAASSVAPSSVAPSSVAPSSVAPSSVAPSSVAASDTSSAAASENEPVDGSSAPRQ